MSYSDTYGSIIDSYTVEQAFKTSLAAFIEVNLRTQEERLDLDQGALPPIRSWPIVSDFDIRPHEQLPAIVITSPGHGSPAHDRGVYRIPWRIEVAVVVASHDENDARRLAAIYMAAIEGAVLNDRTLGDLADTTVWVGPGDQAIAIAAPGDARAIYGTTFEVTVRNTIPRTSLTPPEDPDETPPAPQSSLEAEFIVTSIAPEDTP